MYIKYKNYIGAIIHMEQVMTDMFAFRIKDIDGVIIEFRAKINQIKIVNCEGNREILSEILERCCI